MGAHLNLHFSVSPSRIQDFLQINSLTVTRVVRVSLKLRKHRRCFTHLHTCRPCFTHLHTCRPCLTHLHTCPPCFTHLHTCRPRPCLIHFHTCRLCLTHLHSCRQVLTTCRSWYRGERCWFCCLWLCIRCHSHTTPSHSQSWCCAPPSWHWPQKEGKGSRLEIVVTCTCIQSFITIYLINAL